MSSHQESKDELERLIRESRRKSKEIIRRSSNLLQWGQYMTDLADASEKVMEYPSPSSIDWEPIIDSWRYANEQQNEILASVGSVSIQTAMASGSTATYAMTDFAKPNNLVRFVSIDKQDKARAAAEQLSQVIDRLAEKNTVSSLLRQYGLTSAAPEQKSPAELFETAWAAFEKPVTGRSPAATSLIPMRECINGTIAALLRRRPRQEPAKSQQAKITSLGSQLSGDSVSSWAIQSLAERWTSLVDELSDSKQKDFSREEWRDCLWRASLFLMELLQSLDQSKMK